MTDRTIPSGPIPANAGAQLRSVVRGTMTKGGYLYVYKGVADPNLRMTVVAEQRRGPETITWTHALLPDREFPSLPVLREARDKLTATEVLHVLTTWPRVTEVKPDECGNACRFCPHAFTGKRVMHDTIRVTIEKTWHDTTCFSACKDHAPGSVLSREVACLLLDALDNEVAERLARAQEMRSATPGLNGPF